jgi:hypothetical protein
MKLNDRFMMLFVFYHKQLKNHVFVTAEVGNIDFHMKKKVELLLGAAEMLMANAVSQLAEKTPGKESVAIESFARALRQVIK